MTLRDHPSEVVLHLKGIRNLAISLILLDEFLSILLVLVVDINEYVWCIPPPGVLWL